ncbi:MAG: DUF2520 domain-containing protein [Prevotellaceae bacterium]|jgi:predicted short-subunit dehydrogenase-like oxidoreductase (DUF2520 family)|nr:DUF2520 domain-containing protein [Prevotellaceae bacterium]
MKIVFIGAGNVASNISLTLKEKGFDIVQIYSKTVSSAQTLADELDCEFITEFRHINRDADVYFYTLKDRYIGIYAQRNRFPNAIHIHTAGSIPLDIFEGYANNYGVIYPLQTFTKGKNVRFDGVPFFIEANNQETEKTLQIITKTLSDNIYYATSAQRKKLHISAIFACNFVNHMYAIAANMVEGSQFDFDILRPLIKETAEKINYMHPLDAQTGPAVRYDKKVIDDHIESISNENVKEIYRLLSENIYKKAMSKKNNQST